jgi:signal transduction histidine kinase
MTVGFLLKQFDTFSREKIIEHLKRTDESAERLVKLVNDFLNVSRLQQGRIEANNKPFDMIKLTNEVISELAPLAKERKLFINHESSDAEYRIVVGDIAKAKEVLINLISNGIKYTIRGGLTVSHQANTTTLLTKITDTGNGIPQDYQSILFKRFSQVGSARLQSTEKSSGLGLYISKKLAKLMRGDVYLETSEPGKGSTFTFMLPLG